MLLQAVNFTGYRLIRRTLPISNIRFNITLFLKFINNYSMGNLVKGFRGVKRQNYNKLSRAIIDHVIFSLQRENVAVKVLKPDASDQSSNDFVKEVQNMVELASKQKCLFIIELRGVSKGIVLLLLVPIFKILMTTTEKSTNIEQLYIRSRKNAKCVD